MGYRLDIYFDQRLKEAKGNDQIYGGLHVIDFGDLYQLPPVGDSYIFGKIFNKSNSNPSSRIEDLTPHPWEQMRIFELKQVMRQKGEAEFVSALNHMRDNSATESNCWNFIRKREVSVVGVPPLDCPIAAYTNRRVAELNEQARLRCPLPEIQIQAKDSSANVDSLIQEDFLINHASKMEKNKTGGLPTRLTLRKEMVVEITRNINKSDGLVNGADGILRGWDDLLLDPINKCYSPDGYLWIEFYDPSVGTITRQANRNLYTR